MGERKRETVKERERERGVRERERRAEYENRGGKEYIVPEKQMCQNCMPTTNVNSLCIP